MTFQTAVDDTTAIKGAYRKGLGALRGTDRQHIEAEDTRRLTGSVNLDEALKDGFPKDHRWDYAIGHQPANLREETVYWVEIHPASTGEVNVVPAKLQWVKKWLRQDAPKLNAMRREFLWISSGKTSFTLTSTQQ